MKGTWPAAIIFDFDGVIVNSEPLHCRAFQRMVAEQGMELTEDQYYRELIGFDDRGAVAHLFRFREPQLDSATFSTLCARKAAIVQEMMNRGEFEPLPHVKQFVELCSAKFPLAICSGALRNEIETMLNAIRLRSYFGVIVSAEDVAIGKPDPSGYQLATQRVAEKIGTPLRPADILIIEDAPSVVDSVKRAGFRALAVTTSYPRAALAAADWVLGGLNPAEVREAIPEMGLDV